jgi:hypothetical protein
MTAPGAAHAVREDRSVAFVRTERPRMERSPPSPIGSSDLTFEADMNPSSDMLVSKITLPIERS